MAESALLRIFREVRLKEEEEDRIWSLYERSVPGGDITKTNTLREYEHIVASKARLLNPPLNPGGPTTKEIALQLYNFVRTTAGDGFEGLNPTVTTTTTTTNIEDTLKKERERLNEESARRRERVRRERERLEEEKTRWRRTIEEEQRDEKARFREEIILLKEDTGRLTERLIVEEADAAQSREDFDALWEEMRRTRRLVSEMSGGGGGGSVDTANDDETQRLARDARSLVGALRDLGGDLTEAAAKRDAQAKAVLVEELSEARASERAAADEIQFLSNALYTEREAAKISREDQTFRDELADEVELLSRALLVQREETAEREQDVRREAETIRDGLTEEVRVLSRALIRQREDHAMREAAVREKTELATTELFDEVEQLSRRLLTEQKESLALQQTEVLRDEELTELSRALLLNRESASKELQNHRRALKVCVEEICGRDAEISRSRKEVIEMSDALKIIAGAPGGPELFHHCGVAVEVLGGTREEKTGGFAALKAKYG